MTEIPQNPDQSKGIQNAKVIIIDLFLANLIVSEGNAIAPQDKFTPIEISNIDIPEYKEKVTKFVEMLEFANKAVEIYSEALLNTYRRLFTGPKDFLAKELLISIIFSRISTLPGYFDYSIKLRDELEQLGNELGLVEGWTSEKARNMTLDYIVEQYLSGNLRIFHLPISD